MATRYLDDASVERKGQLVKGPAFIARGFIKVADGWPAAGAGAILVHYQGLTLVHFSAQREHFFPMWWGALLI